MNSVLLKTHMFLEPDTDGYDSQEIGIDEFIALCDELGSEPAFTMRMSEKTPEDAAALVEYCNGGPDTKWGKIRAQRGHLAPYQVKCWFMGNELYMFGRGGLNKADVCAIQTKQFAEAMKKVDRTIQISDCTACSADWDKKMIEQGGDMLDLYSIHNYMGYLNNDLSALAKAPIQIMPVNEGAIEVAPLGANLDAAGQVFALYAAHQGNRLLKTPAMATDADIDPCASRIAPRKTAKSTSWRIVHYSGIATYRKTFDLPKAEALNFRVLLDLGVVNAMARVRLNGQDCGVAWTAPWRVDISKALKPTANALEVEVANLWPNRMLGDARNRDVRVYLNAGVYKKEHDKWAGTAVQEPGGMVVVANRPKSCTATLPQRALLYGNHFDEARRVVGWLERTLPRAERYAKGGLTLQNTSVKNSGGANYGTMMSYDGTIPEPPTEGEGLLAYEDFTENNATLMALDYVDWSGDRSYDKVALRIRKETTWLTPSWWYQILASEDPLVRDSYALFRTSKTGDYVFNNGRMRVFAAKLHEGDEAGRWAKRFMQPGVTLFDDTCFGEIVSDFEDFKKTPEVAAHGALICNITQMRVVPDDDATITVFPAIPTEWERPGVAFCNLAAKGAILVSDMSKKGERERNRGDGHWHQAGRTTHKSTHP